MPSAYNVYDVLSQGFFLGGGGGKGGQRGVDFHPHPWNFYASSLYHLSFDVPSDVFSL